MGCKTDEYRRTAPLVSGHCSRSLKYVKYIRMITVKFNPIRPVYLMHTPDVTEDESDAALEALHDILDIAGMAGRIQVTDLGVWREEDYVDANGELVPHKSVDWYVEKWYNPERGQVDMDTACPSLLRIPGTGRNPITT